VVSRNREDDMIRRAGLVAIAACLWLAGGCALGGGALGPALVGGAGGVLDPYGRPLASYPVPPGIASRNHEGIFRVAIKDANVVSNRSINTFYLAPDGTAVLVIEPNRAAVDLAWSMTSNNALCIRWPLRGQECWPYHAMQLQRPVRMISDRGIVADVTLLLAPPMRRPQ
jgi:hypothetical protein